MRGLIIVISFLLASSILTTCVVKDVQFTQNCKGYIKRAADANTIEMAKTELEKAVAYMEENHLTEGYTSVIYRTPDEDIKFWYTNIKSSLEELKNLPAEVTPLERSNMLMKLRETLLDNGEKGQSVTRPDGIQRYPNNLLWGILNIIQTIAWAAFFVLVFLALDDL